MSIHRLEVAQAVSAVDADGDAEAFGDSRLAGVERHGDDLEVVGMLGDGEVGDPEDVEVLAPEACEIGAEAVRQPSEIGHDDGDAIPLPGDGR